MEIEIEETYISLKYKNKSLMYRYGIFSFIWDGLYHNQRYSLN